LWPAFTEYERRQKDYNDELRRIFREVAHAVEMDNLRLALRVKRASSVEDPVSRRIGYEVKSVPINTRTQGRLDPRLYFIVDMFLLKTTPKVVASLESLLLSLPECDLALIDRGALEGMNIDIINSLNMRSIAKLQVFLMGYYYSVLGSLLDTSQLDIKEAFGSWGWYDHNLMKNINSFRSGCSDPAQPRGSKATVYHSLFVPRVEVLKFTAYLFAGAGWEDVQNLPPSSIGVIGKLILVTSTLLSSPSNNTELGKMHLLDIDSTAIPSNARGIITPGVATPITFNKSDWTIQSLDNIKDSGRGPIEDFTLHLEPDWERDVQTCLLNHRYKGRLVTKIDALQKLEAMHHLFVETGIPEGQKNSYEVLQPETRSSEHWLNVVEIGLEDFHNSSVHYGRMTGSETYNGSILFARKCPHARACITTMYDGFGVDIRLVASVAEALGIKKAEQSSFVGLFIVVEDECLNQPNIVMESDFLDFYQKSSPLRAIRGRPEMLMSSGWY